MQESRPGLANTNRARKGAFSSLTASAIESPDALDALLFAYEALATAERLRMIEAVLQDAERPAPVLATMLMVESAPALRAHLGTRLRELASTGVAFVTGDASQGQAELVEVGSGGERQYLRIAWVADEITELDLGTTGSPPRGQPTTREAAIELIAPMFWRHLRRDGGVPPGLERFARFF